MYLERTKGCQLFYSSRIWGVFLINYEIMYILKLFEDTYAKILEKSHVALEYYYMLQYYNIQYITIYKILQL